MLSLKVVIIKELRSGTGLLHFYAAIFG